MFESKPSLAMPAKISRLGVHRHGLLHFYEKENPQYPNQFRISEIELVTRAGRVVKNLYPSPWIASGLGRPSGDKWLGRAMLYRHPLAEMHAETDDGVDWSGYVCYDILNGGVRSAGYASHEMRLPFVPDSNGQAAFVRFSLWDISFSKIILLPSGPPQNLNLAPQGAAHGGILLHASETGREVWFGEMTEPRYQSFSAMELDGQINPRWVRPVLSKVVMSGEVEPVAPGSTTPKITAVIHAVEPDYDLEFRSVGSSWPPPTGMLEMGVTRGEECAPGFTPVFNYTPPTLSEWDTYKKCSSSCDVHVDSAGNHDFLIFGYIAQDWQGSDTGDLISDYHVEEYSYDSYYCEVHGLGGKDYGHRVYSTITRNYESYERYGAELTGWGGVSKIEVFDTVLSYRTVRMRGNASSIGYDPEHPDWGRPYPGYHVGAEVISSNENREETSTIKIEGRLVFDIPAEWSPITSDFAFAPAPAPAALSNSTLVLPGFTYASSMGDGAIVKQFSFHRYTYGSHGFHALCVRVTTGTLHVTGTEEHPAFMVLSPEHEIHFGGTFARGKFYPSHARVESGALDKAFWCAYDPFTDSISDIYTHPIYFQ